MLTTKRKAIRLKTMLRHLVVFTVVLSFVSFAQSFVFVTDRVAPLNADWNEPEQRQTDIFLFEDGSEVALTHTNTLSEYDPTPSPDGRYLAYAESDFVYPNDFESSSWHYVVLDLVSKQEVARFDMPNAVKTFRPAGGFMITWKADSSGFFAQVSSSDYFWDIYEFSLLSMKARFVGSGFGIALNDVSDRLATTQDGFVKLIRLHNGAEWRIIAGEALAWLGLDLVVAQENSLFLIKQRGGGEELFDFLGFYTAIAFDKTKSRYAFTLLQEDQWFVVLATAEHELIAKQSVDGLIDSLVWLEDSLLVAYLPNSEAQFVISELTLDGRFRPLVASQADNFFPKAISER